MVSACGFTSTALSKSKALGIRCLSIDQVDALPWMFNDFKFKQFHISYKHFDFTIIPEEDFLNKPKAFDLIYEHGESVSVDALQRSIFNAIKERETDPENTKIGERAEKFRLIVPNLTIIDKDTGVFKKVKHINTVVYSETKVAEVPFVLQEYKDVTSKTAISQLAVAKVDFGFTRGRLVINHKIETGGEVVFIPDAEKPNRMKTDDE